MSAWTARPMVLLAGVLALSLAASGWIGAEENAGADIVQAVTRGPGPAAVVPADDPDAGAQQAKGGELGEWSRDAGEGAVKELFAARSWQVQQAQAAQPPAPEPAAAPAVPFVYIGKMINEGRTTVFLTYQDRSLAVREGDVIDGSYRIDSIKGSTLTLTYLPLESAQTIHIGDAN